MSILECKNIKKIYQTKNLTTEALRDVSFSVEKGEFISIMGESGAGKTTLLNILATLDNPSSGVLLLNGRNMGSLKKEEVSAFRRRELGLSKVARIFKRVVFPAPDSPMIEINSPFSTEKFTSRRASVVRFLV